MLDGRFADKIVVVTGVNDRGIGAAIAERLSDEGATVCLLWKDRPLRLLKRLSRRNRSFLEIECDVTSHSSVSLAVERIVDTYSCIDILVNNAGIDHNGTLEETSEDEWQRVVDVNLTGSMRMIRSTLPHLKRGSGAIINLASVLGIAGCGGFSAYSATKAGIIGMTQSLAMDLAPQGIRAVCVAPALVQTPMIHKYIETMNESDEELIQQSHPLGIGTPQDVASAVAFMASAEARWITGVTLPLGWAATFSLPVQNPSTKADKSNEHAIPFPLRHDDMGSHRAAG